MPWIFGLFLVTPCVLTSFHVVRNKQDSTIRALRSEGDYMRRTTRSYLDTECRESQSSEGHAADPRRIWWACKEVQALAPPDSWKKIWEQEVISLSICFSTHLSHTTETSTLSRIKCERYIFIKCVRSFSELRK